MGQQARHSGTGTAADGAPLTIQSTGMAPLQRGNERWLESSGAGMVVRTLGALPAAVAHVLTHVMDFRAAAERHAGRGVFEAAEAICSSLVGSADSKR